MHLESFVATTVLSTLLKTFAEQHKVRVEVIDNRGRSLFQAGEIPFLCQIVQNRDHDLSEENYRINSGNTQFNCEGGLTVLSFPLRHKEQNIGSLIVHGLKTQEVPSGFQILSEQINVEESELYDEYEQLSLVSPDLLRTLYHQIQHLSLVLPELCVAEIKDRHKIKSLSSFQTLHNLLSSTTDFEKVINSILSFLVTELPFTHSVIHLLDLQQAYISSPLPGPREEIESRLAQSMGDYSQTVSNISTDFSFSTLEGVSSLDKSVHGFSVVSSGQRAALVFCYGKPGLVLNQVDRELLDVLKYRFRDIIIKHLELSYAQRSAITDKLTTLFNRRYFNDRLSLELAECQELKDPISLIMVDIDHFKKLNDTFGHQKGDEVLATFGSIIKSVLRRSDIPCRYGGEEFSIILSHTALSDAKMVAERLREAVEKHDFGHIEESTPVTCSVGLATCSNGSVDAHILLKEADSALYRAKNLGRNRVECSLMVDRNMGTIDANEADDLYVQKGSN